MKLLLSSLSRKVPFFQGHFIRRCTSSQKGRTSASRTADEAKIQDTASTVVIGGGTVGCSVAYHLARMGEKNVVLLEKSELTAGSTWHAAGLTTIYQRKVSGRKLYYYSMNMYAELARETGQDIGLRQPGSIRVASDPKRIDELRSLMSKHRLTDAAQCLLSPEEIKKLNPLINTDEVVIGLYTAGDGYVDPYSLTQAIAQGAKSYGATIILRTGVNSLTLREDGRWVVGTPRGDIVASKVVNAAGFWAREVAKLAGINLPIVTFQHQYIVTSSMPEVQALDKEFPVIRHLDCAFYLRKERNGLLIGLYDTPSSIVSKKDWYSDGVPPDFGKELFQPDLDKISPTLEKAMNVIPSFAKASIHSVINGPLCIAPDATPVLGPSMLPGMWLAVGFGMNGVTQGGGAGHYLSEWMVKGEPPYSLTDNDPRRLGPWLTDESAILSAEESVGGYVKIYYPQAEYFSGRPHRVSGAYKRQVERGAYMVASGGWEQAAWFANSAQEAEYAPSFKRTSSHEAVGKEVRSATSNAGVIDLTPSGKIMVTGTQAARFLDYVTTNTLPRKGEALTTHVLTPSGKVYSTSKLLCTDENTYLMTCDAASELRLLRWLQDKAMNNWNVSLRNVSADIGCLGLAGPKSQEILSKMSSRFQEDFPMYTVEKVNIAETEATVVSSSGTGELGWELYHPKENTTQLYEAILHHGTSFGLSDFGKLAMNVLRCEKGFKSWGTEVTLDTTAVDAGIMDCVKMDKEDFIGKGAVAEHLKSRPLRKLAQIKITSRDVDPDGNEAIWVADKVVGQVTSGCFSYHLSTPIAFCFLPTYLAYPGNEVQVELLGEMCVATVLEKPPVQAYHTRTA